MQKFSSVVFKNADDSNYLSTRGKVIFDLFLVKARTSLRGRFEISVLFAKDNGPNNITFIPRIVDKCEISPFSVNPYAVGRDS